MKKDSVIDNAIKRVVLLGRPNSGKTSIFNELSGQMQKVGNWSGVTVAASSAQLNCNNQNVEILDLPGCHTLISCPETPNDEKIALESLWQHNDDTVVVNVVNAASLRRDLYLTRQLIEIWRGPIIVALNCMDLAIKKGIKIDVTSLSRELELPVIPIVAKNKQGIGALFNEIKSNVAMSAGFVHHFRRSPKALSNIVSSWGPAVSELFPNLGVEGVISQALEGNSLILEELNNIGLKQGLLAAKSEINTSGIEFDIFMARFRYDEIDNIISKACAEKSKKSPLQRRPELNQVLDKLFLNRFLGLPVFLLFMYLMFIFSINFGGAFQDAFDLSSQAVFIAAPKQLLTHFGISDWLQSIISGVGHGINVTLTFVPVLFAMFLALAFMEQSGYMARAAFLIDRFMRYLGLPGKAFIPMIVGFGCNVPAVMGARTLNNKNERIITIMMMPFMSCSARLAIYTVFVAAFFSEQGHNIIFSLYLLGILVALLTGVFLRATILDKSKSELVLELPDYQFPKFSQLCKHSWFKLKKFIIKAGLLIIPMCALLNVIGACKDDIRAYSSIERAGRIITPALAPMGIDKDNWQATVGLLAGMAAKEVMIGSLSTLYASESEDSEHVQDESIVGLLTEAKDSIIENVSSLGEVFINPFAASAPDSNISESMMGVMSLKFGGAIPAFSYLLFVLLYFPCISVVAAIAKELNKSWAFFSIIWSTSLAYVVSVMFYQLATYSSHPTSSVSWVVGIGASFLVIGLILRSIFTTKAKSILAQYSKFPTPVVYS